MYLLFDIGGTKTRIASSRNGKIMDRVIICRSMKNFAPAMKLFTKHIQELTGGVKIQKAAVGWAGVLNLQRTKPLASNLKAWDGKPLKKSLEKIIKAPVLLGNDAAFAALGEATVGAGKGYDIVAYLTHSTGLGGARVSHGKIDACHYGFEPGKQIIQFKKPLYGRQSIKTVEQLVAGKFLLKKYKKRPEEITDTKLWREIESYLAIGVHNVTAMWSPDVIVIGGGIGTSRKINLKRVQTQAHKLYFTYMKPTPVRRAKLGDTNGLYGALAYIRNNPKMK